MDGCAKVFLQTVLLIMIHTEQRHWGVVSSSFWGFLAIKEYSVVLVVLIFFLESHRSLTLISGVIVVCEVTKLTLD